MGSSNSSRSFIRESCKGKFSNWNWGEPPPPSPKKKKERKNNKKKIERPLIQKIWTVGLVTIYFMLILLDRPVASAASKTFQIPEQVSIATRYRITLFLNLLKLDAVWYFWRYSWSSELLQALDYSVRNCELWRINLEYFKKL